MREQKGIDGSAGKDAMAAICCPCCVSIQVANELDHYEKAWFICTKTPLNNKEM